MLILKDAGLLFTIKLIKNDTNLGWLWQEEDEISPENKERKLGNY
jgi:hypothetical protein